MKRTQERRVKEKERRMQEPDAPRYALLEAAAHQKDGQLPIGPHLDPEVGGKRNGA